MSIPADIIERVRSSASLAELVSETVELKRSGRQLRGCCPFHSEKTPSFFVNDEEGFFNCFGCGKKGSLFDFVMETRGFSFPEAVKFLASRVGISVPDDYSPQDKKKSKEESEYRQATRAVLRVVTEIYQEQLNNLSLDYLKKRGISNDSIKKFQIGYGPNSWEFLLAKVVERLAGQKIGNLTFDEAKCQELLQKTGLIKLRQNDRQNEKDSFFDTFRDRLIFVITRSDGAPVALGGRLLGEDKDKPKYLNTSESPVYQKRKTFYGLGEAISEIRKCREVYVVEGYFDVISVSQLGLTNVLATCGTAVTPDHVKLLKRLVDKVTLVFDGDTAGRKAAAGCFELFLNSGIKVSVALLPEGEDPDSIAQKVSKESKGNTVWAKEQLQKRFSANELPLVKVYLDFLAEQMGVSSDQPDPAFLGKLASKFVSIIKRSENAVEQEYLLKACAERFSISTDSLNKLIEKSKQSSTKEYSQIMDRSFYERQGSVVNFPKKTPTKNSISRAEESAYITEVLVSSICDGSAAQLVLDQLLKLDDQEVYGFPLETRNFLQELTNAKFSGLLQVVKEENAQPKIQEAKEFIKVHAENFGFDGEVLFSQAYAKVKTGGSNFKRSAIESLRFVRAFRIRAEVKNLQENLLADLDEKSRLEVAQKIISEKQKLEKIFKESSEF